jgi:hypothetical protein
MTTKKIAPSTDMEKKQATKRKREEEDTKNKKPKTETKESKSVTTETKTKKESTKSEDDGYNVGPSLDSFRISKNSIEILKEKGKHSPYSHHRR